VKTAGSRRPVPMHPELIRLGFLRYIEERRKQGDARLAVSATDLLRTALLLAGGAGALNDRDWNAVVIAWTKLQDRMEDVLRDKAGVPSDGSPAVPPDADELAAGHPGLDLGGLIVKQTR
jgi:hypothetical protein